MGILGHLTRGGAACQGPRNSGAVALSFDDGPDPRWTPGVLKALRIANQHATFFCVGAAARSHPELVREIASAGHEIGTHLWSHARETVDDDQAFDDELARSLELLSELSAGPIRHLRYPYGRPGRQKPIRLARFGVRAVHWTVSALDSRLADPAAIVARLKPAMRPGAIVLMHDGVADEARIAPPYLRTRDAMVAALPRVLDVVAELGLRSVTLGTMLPILAR